MTNELITVIIPCYNVEKYLSECIDSILNQTYSCLEILLINDGSTDSTGDICDRYKQKDSRIRVIHQSNKGIATTRNIGVKEATGKYIFWIDSDDYVCSYIIEKLYKLLIDYSADMSICNYIEGSCRNYNFQKKDSIIECFEARQGLNYIYKNNHYSFIMAASWAKLIKKSCYDSLRYPDGKIFEDIYISHHLIHNCQRIVYTDEIMYYYYKWPESILGKKIYKAKLDYLGAFEERIHFFESLGYDELKEKARIQYLHALIWEFSRAKDILHDSEMVKTIVKQYRKYYTLGTMNQEIKNETREYMFTFYVSPYLRDFIDKIKCKLSRKGN